MKSHRNKMRTPMTLPSALKEYLNSRGISDAVIEKHRIGWNGKAIVIPVFNETGRVIFNKYRRSPKSDVGPKYTYDKGAVAAIYNVENLHHAKRIVITEGELDALVLESNGYTAVSSTGGSGTFKNEWANHFSGKDVFVCYDNDEAGIAGAIRVASIIPQARIIQIPKGGEVKDVTDFFTKTDCPLTNFEELMNEANHLFSSIKCTEGMTDKKSKELLSIELDRLTRQKRSAMNEGRDYGFIDEAIKFINDSIERIDDKIRRKNIPHTLDASRIDIAKAYPIDALIEFNYQGFARCLWHEEKTPSMHYYKDKNRVSCFGCSKHGDSIDVYQKLHNCSVKQAIDELIKLNGKN